jgi:hypothetical protein
MSANTSRRGIVCFLPYTRSDQKPGTEEEVLHSTTQHLEGGVEQRWSNHEDKVPSGGDMIVDQPDGFARATLGTIAIMSFAELFAHDKPTTRATGSVSARVEDQERVRPRFSLAAHPPKLIGTSEPLITAHRNARRTDQGTKRQMDEPLGLIEDLATSSMASIPCSCYD